MIADASEVRALAEQIASADPAWELDRTVELGEGLAWRPDLVRADPRSCMHIHLSDRLRPYVVQRMVAAYAADHEIHLVAPLQALYDEPLVQALAPLEAAVWISDGAELSRPAPLLACIADRGVQLTSDVRKEVASKALELSRQDAPPHIRGRRLEAAVCFLLSQVDDFDVVERNYRTDTEELDAVVQQRATHGRVWSTLAAPLILVEAKNWKANPVPQKEVSALRIKMEGRRGTVRLALMIAGEAGFASDALDQEVRFASGDLTIAFVTQDELSDWSQADDLSEHLEQIVRRAMLR